MGVDLEVVFAATVTAEEAFSLPERLNRAPRVVAACRAYYQRMKPSMPGLEPCAWSWHQSWPMISTPSAIVDAWASPFLGNVMLAGTPGLLSLQPRRITLGSCWPLAGFAADHEGCQAPIRQVCRALADALGTDRVLYLPDSGDWPPELRDLHDPPFDETLARLTAWGPPVSAPGALGYGRAVRSGYHYAGGALRRPDGTPVPEDEIAPHVDWYVSGGIAYYLDGNRVPPEELARRDLRGGFAYYVDDFRDLA